MGIGVYTDLIQYNEQFYGGFIESVASNLDVFNAASQGTMLLETDFHRGLRKEEGFFLLSTGIQHRNEGSVAAATDTNLPMGETKMVKILKRAMHAATLQSFKDQNMSQEEIVFMAGRQAGQGILEQWRESAISSLVGGFGIASLLAGGADELVYDGTAGTLNTSTLIAAMPLMGDRSGAIKAFVMHSKAYWDLVGNQAASTTADGVADMVVMSGTPATLGRPVIVVDSPALIVVDGVAAGVDKYKTFALTEGAVKAQESARPEVYTTIVDGLENLVQRVQSEYTYSVGLKGISYSSATNNPTDAELATAANWSKVYTSKKDLPGILIETR